MATVSDQILQRYNQLFDTIGRAGLNGLFPNDFEVYMVSLELTTSRGELVDFLSFPILPKSMSQSEAKRINVKKSLQGIVVTTSNSFTPKEITMQGNFGRSFKIALSPRTTASGVGFKFSTRAGIFKSTDTNPRSTKLTTPVFDSTVKTGYGLIKILQSIIDKSTSLDDEGRPFRLFLHNPTIGGSWLVTPTQNPLVLGQNLQLNMIHTYNLNLTLLAPLDSLRGEISSTSLLEVATVGVVQKGVNTLARDLRRIL